MRTRVGSVSVGKSDTRRHHSFFFFFFSVRALQAQPVCPPEPLQLDFPVTNGATLIDLFLFYLFVSARVPSFSSWRSNGR